MVLVAHSARDRRSSSSPAPATFEKDSLRGELQRGAPTPTCMKPSSGWFPSLDVPNKAGVSRWNMVGSRRIQGWNSCFDTLCDCYSYRALFYGISLTEAVERIGSEHTSFGALNRTESAPCRKHHVQACLQKASSASISAQGW